MRTNQNDAKKETMKITLGGKQVILKFTDEPNMEAADFIKKALINAFLVKTI